MNITHTFSILALNDHKQTGDHKKYQYLPNLYSKYYTNDTIPVVFVVVTLIVVRMMTWNTVCFNATVYCRVSWLKSQPVMEN